MSGLLSEHKELAQKVLFVKDTLLRLLSSAVVALEHDERLLDLGLLGLGSGTEDRVVGGDVSPSEHSETQSRGDALKGGLLRLGSGCERKTFPTA